MKLAVVVIGRNEGERLRRCLQAIQLESAHTIYVDSGSTDSSVEVARNLGCDVVELDAAQPFTAARARNAGWQRAAELVPDVNAVQFLDGDCEVMPGWLSAAQSYLAEHADCLAVCGHRRERFPLATIYNRLCDIELDTQAGITESSGGDVCVRMDALQEVGGYRESLIAGEDPELCFRLRQTGGQIVQIEHEMSVHDAAMTSFRQWWRRAVRTGHAYAEVSALTRSHPVGLWRSHQRNILTWGAILPLIALGLAWPTCGWSLLLFAAYPLSFVRITLRNTKRLGIADAMLFAVSCVLGKFAHLIGMMKYHWNRWTRRQTELIEYKSIPNSVSGGSS